MGKGQDLYRRARRLIPGGTQLLSKRPEQFLPEGWPAYYSSASGIEVVDLDGRTYRDMGLVGVGACVLGYADPDVDAAAREAIAAGSMCTLNAPEEVELAELLCELHPWAAMVRYARSGGEAMAIAVRIARARTGRDRIALCGYHGWSDWYLAANLGSPDALEDLLMPGLPPAGVPRGLAETALPFHYNRLDELRGIIDRHRGEIAAIVMEPQRDEPPEPGFLETVREWANEIGALLVFDEITTGFRAACGGIHLGLGVEPDLAVFAKGMANGYAMSAIVGTEDAMQAAQSTFISSTSWTERIGPAAALATIRKFRRLEVHEHLDEMGRRAQRGWQDAASRAGLPISVSSLPCLAHFDIEAESSGELVTLFVQRMLEHGYLAYNQLKPSLKHGPDEIDAYIEACRPVLAELGEALESGDAGARLAGPAAQRGFHRLT